MTTINGTRAPVSVLVDDLYFASRISSVAAQMGVPIEFLQPGGQISENARLVLVDLQFSGPWEMMIEVLRDKNVPVIAFGPHEDSELLKRGRAAGCSRVMAKSKFVTSIGWILSMSDVADENLNT